MDKFIRHLDQGVVLTLADQVDYQDGQIVSKTLAQNAALSLTLFAFDAGEEISSHDSSGDAMVTALDGAGEITIGGEVHALKAGETIIMPAKVPHAVYATQRFKMILTVVFPNQR